jgi:hypothetical protein
MTERIEADFAKMKKWHFGAKMYSLDDEGMKKYMAKYASEYYVNPNDWDAKQCFMIGCLRWDDHLMLLPGWVLQLLPDGFELTDIHNEPAIVGKDEFDEELHQGLLKYGVKKEVEEKPQDQNQIGGFDMNAIMDRLSNVTGQQIDSIEFTDEHGNVSTKFNREDKNE